MELGIIPAPADSEPYLELGESAQGTRRFTKHILSVGETFVHPATGAPLTVDESWWADLKRNWDDQVCPIVQFPAANEKNQHTENPLANLGRVTDLRRQGNKIYADLEVPDPAVADKIGSTILGASAMLSLDYRDSRSGRRWGKTLLHVAATNRPHLVSLDPYEELVAACAEDMTLPDGSVWSDAAAPLMLCASDPDLLPPVLLADPEPDREHDCYYERPGMHDEDFLRVEAARLGLLAYQESVPGRGTRPEYGGIITDFDRQAALSAEAEISDADIIEATAELAEGYRVSTDAVHAMAHDAHVRSGLGRTEIERARVLGEVRVALSRGRPGWTTSRLSACRSCTTARKRCCGSPPGPIWRTCSAWPRGSCPRCTIRPSRPSPRTRTPWSRST